MQGLHPPENVVQEEIVPPPACARARRQARHQLRGVARQRAPAVQAGLQAEEALRRIQHLGVQLDRVCRKKGTEPRG